MTLSMNLINWKEKCFGKGYDLGSTLSPTRQMCVLTQCIFGQNWSRFHGLTYLKSPNVYSKCINLLDYLSQKLDYHLEINVCNHLLHIGYLQNSSKLKEVCVCESAWPILHCTRT